MKRRICTAATIIGLTVIVGMPAARASDAPPTHPNIVFIMADDLGYGELGCYGQKTLATPNIDRLAADGLRFTDCYAGSTVCAPSRCVLMTGLHTGHCRVRGNARVPLLPDDVTVAEVLKQAGYKTGIVGKWGLGEPNSTGLPNRQGFDYWFGYLNQRHAHNYYPEYLWRNEEKVPLEGNVAEGGVASQRSQYSHELMTKEALGFLDRNHDGPFFLYVPFTLPHVNNERTRATGDGMEVPDYGIFADKDWPNPEKGRAAMIAMLDRDVGKIMDRIKDLGIDDQTIVFFTSDNGAQQEGGSKIAFFESSGPLRGYKRDLYEGGIRVPMIVRWPGTIKPGRTSDFASGFWDFLPTAANLAGVSPPKDIDGISVLPTLLGKKQEGDRFMYWEFHERGSSRAVRMGKWKAVQVGSPTAPLELYDLTSDIGEKHDLAKSHPDIVSQISNYLNSARTESKHWPLREPMSKRNRPRKPASSGT